MRGAAGRGRPAQHRGGIIPARAGSRTRSTARRRRPRDHPRACGEQASLTEQKNSRAGSSPRVRGAASAPTVTIAKTGIIPARAGSSYALLEEVIGYLGSSPRVRGAEWSTSTSGWRLGIIPARAGSSRPSRACAGSRRDHPRACGEQLRICARSSLCPGSSPRVRGAGSEAPEGRERHGIIPARAGSRSFCESSASAARDHPRACGEQYRFNSREQYEQGSSPRVRGAVKSSIGGVYDFGIIPARAGSRTHRA